MPSNPSLNISYLVDTDVIIDYLRNRPYAVGFFSQRVEQGILGVSTITHLEILRGMRLPETEKTMAVLDSLVAINIDVPIAQQAGRLIAAQRALGQTVGIGDAIIAATALKLDIPLLTNNAEHYNFQGLRVVKGLPAS